MTFVPDGKPRRGPGRGLAVADICEPGSLPPRQACPPPWCRCPTERVQGPACPFPHRHTCPSPRPAAREPRPRSSCLDLLHICSSFHAPRAPGLPRSAASRREVLCCAVSTLSRAWQGRRWAGGGRGPQRQVPPAPGVSASRLPRSPARLSPERVGRRVPGGRLRGQHRGLGWPALGPGRREDLPLGAGGPESTQGPCLHSAAHFPDFRKLRPHGRRGRGRAGTPPLQPRAQWGLVRPVMQ